MKADKIVRPKTYYISTNLKSLGWAEPIELVDLEGYLKKKCFDCNFVDTKWNNQISEIEVDFRGSIELFGIIILEYGVMYSLANGCGMEHYYVHQKDPQIVLTYEK